MYIPLVVRPTLNTLMTILLMFYIFENNNFLLYLWGFALVIYELLKHKSNEILNAKWSHGSHALVFLSMFNMVLCSSPFEEESNLLIRKLLEDESMLLHWMNIGRHPIVRGILFCVHIYIACEGLGIMQLGVPNPFVAWIVPRTSSSKKC